MAKKEKSQKIVIIGTLDTKGQEVDFLKKEIEKEGCEAFILDVGVLGKPFLESDYSRREIAQLGGKNLDELVNAAKQGGDRSDATVVMMKGASRKVNELFSQGALQGAISLGGSTGTAIGIAALKSLPIGIPKLMIATKLDMAGDIGEKDVTVMQTPTDILGLNRVMKRTLRQAAGAIVGMVKNSSLEEDASTKPMVGITALGVTTPLVMKVTELLEKKGLEAIIFHNVVKNMEELAESGTINGIIDVSPGELVRTYAAGLFPELKSRLDIVNKISIPMVIAPGSFDMIILRDAWKDVVEKYRNRLSSKHGPLVTLISTNVKEIKIMGKVIATKANAAKGPVSILIPLKGFSALDKEGQAFYNPARTEAFVKTVKKNVAGHVGVVEVDHHINDEEFAEELCKQYFLIGGEI